MDNVLLLFYISVTTVAYQCAADMALPSYLPRCRVDDPQIGSCLLNATRAMRPKIKEGMSEMGIPSFHPLVLPYFGINITSDLVTCTSAFWNYTIHGMENYDITYIQYDPNTMTFSGEMKFDPLSITSRYIFNGRLLFIPITGDGVVNCVLGPINGTFQIMGNMNRRSKDYYDLTDVKVRLNIDDMILQIGGLLGGNAEQAAMTNELVVRNSKMIAEALTPAFENLSETYIKRYLIWLTRKIPFYKLFPND